MHQAGRQPRDCPGDLQRWRGRLRSADSAALRLRRCSAEIFEGDRNPIILCTKATGLRYSPETRREVVTCSDWVSLRILPSSSDRSHTFRTSSVRGIATPPAGAPAEPFARMLHSNAMSRTDGLSQPASCSGRIPRPLRPPRRQPCFLVRATDAAVRSPAVSIPFKVIHISHTNIQSACMRTGIMVAPAMPAGPALPTVPHPSITGDAAVPCPEKWHLLGALGVAHAGEGGRNARGTVHCPSHRHCPCTALQPAVLHLVEA